MMLTFAVMAGKDREIMPLLYKLKVLVSEFVHLYPFPQYQSTVYSETKIDMEYSTQCMFDFIMYQYCLHFKMHEFCHLLSFY